MKLYDFPLSGNCHKVRLMLSLLQLDYDLIPVNLKEGEQKSAAFLQLNPLGQVPVLIDDDVVVWDSQAILVYLARRYGGEQWLPTDADSMSKVMQWLSITANNIQNSMAAARLHFLFNTQLDLDLAQQKAYQILQIFNEHLSRRDWLECDRLTIADIACFPYIALAPQGKISLDAYPHVTNWINRIKDLPSYISMPGIGE
ncbi:glutathione S-transferase family protein [Gloeocapsa sp. BRSZ]